MDPFTWALKSRAASSKPIYSSSVRIRKRWTIGGGGERGSGISVLMARQDDDDIIIQSPSWTRYSTGSIFKQCIVGLNLNSSFSLTGCLKKIKSPITYPSLDEEEEKTRIHDYSKDVNFKLNTNSSVQDLNSAYRVHFTSYSCLYAVYITFFNVISAYFEKEKNFCIHMTISNQLQYKQCPKVSAEEVIRKIFTLT